jgi:uncharacterized SAM-binding protein YcdF (DUF218 family)
MEKNAQPPHTRKGWRWLRRFGVLAGVAVALFLLRAPLLGGFARLWIVNDPLAPADAIVVLGGGAQSRTFEAARLYHRSLAPKIWVLKPESQPTDELELTMAEHELARRVLLKKDVPENVIEFVGDGVTSTRDEAIAVRDAMHRAGARKVIIPTDMFHTRRVHWLFRKALHPAGGELAVVAIPSHKYDASNWWQHEDGLISLQNEVVKYLYYRVKY